MNKAVQKTMFSSASGDWTTPQDFYDKLNWRFGEFNLDPCATVFNAKCSDFFTEVEDGLTKDWKGHMVFVNPPYDNMRGWAEKCYKESLKPNTKVVLLCPARTDTRYFADFIMKSSQIHFVKGRLKFGNSKNSAPFPSMVVVFDGNYDNAANIQDHVPVIATMSR